MNTKLLIKKQLKGPTKGQSLVEFALAATLMIFLLLATIDFGLAFFSWIALRDAAQEGATYGSLHPPLVAADITAIRNRVKTATTTPVNLGNLIDSDIVVDVLDSTGAVGGTPCPGNGVRVTVTYKYNVITPMISNFIGRSYILISATVADTILQENSAAGCP
jgi:Flp pilus assembly protein TadG